MKPSLSSVESSPGLTFNRVKSFLFDGLLYSGKVLREKLLRIGESTEKTPANSHKTMKLAEVFPSKVSAIQQVLSSTHAL